MAVPIIHFLIFVLLLPLLSLAAVLPVSVYAVSLLSSDLLP